MSDSLEGKISLSDLDKFGIDAKTLGDFDLLAEGVLRILSEELRFVFPAVIMLDKEENGLRIIKYHYPGQISELIQRILGKKIKDVVFLMSYSNNLFVRSYKEQKIFITDSCKKLALPLLDNKVIKFIDTIVNIKMLTVIPVVVNGQSIGVFSFGSRKQSFLSDLERVFLFNLTEQIGIYLKSSWELKVIFEKQKSVVAYKNDLEKLLKIKEKFLVDISQLLEGLSSEFGIQEGTKTDIQDSLKYLKSLFLLSQSIRKKHYGEKDAF